MKKYAFLFVLTIVLAQAAFSQTQFRMKWETSAPFSDRIAPNTVMESWDDSQNVKVGIGFDVIMNRVGIATTSLAQFQKINNDWICDFEQMAGVSLHLFDLKTPIDPYLSAGFGCAGSINLETGARRVAGEENYRGIALGLFPYAGFGVALNLSSIVMGTQILYHPTTMAIPASPIGLYPLRSFECGIFVGFALGDGPGCAPSKENSSDDSFWRN